MENNISRLQQAILFATEQHLGQEREGDAPLPYITHPIEVLINLRYVGESTDEDLLCAAALHDVVEECGTSFTEIENLLGPRVASLAKELTRHEPTEEERAGLDKDQIWQMRSELLLDEISKMSPDAQQVKLADRLSNLIEAVRTKRGKKLARYEVQTKRLLEIVPRSVNPGLWDAIKNRLPK